MTGVQTCALPIFAIFLSTASNQPSVEDLILKGERHLNAWEVSIASDVADRALDQSLSDDDRAKANYFKSMVEYYEGNYDQSLEFGKRAAMSQEAGKGDFSSLPYILEVSAFGRKFREVETRHFKIRYIHPKDSILTDYAETVLETAYYEVGLDLDYYPKGPVVVEIGRAHV